MSYRELEIYRVSEELAIQVHHMSLRLPRFELYEEGSQVRRSSKAVTSHIVEGYGRRRYVADFIKYLIYAISECDETLQHLRFLLNTQSLTDKIEGERLMAEYTSLSKRINKYITWVEGNMEPPNT